jgi:two-component system response regulator FixJ
MSWLASIHHHAPVIVLVFKYDTRSAVRAMKEGACDVLEKPFDAASLLDRVRRAFVLDAELRKDRARAANAALMLTRLTARERQIFDLLCEGWTNKKIAAEFACSARTVEVHRAHVMEKLGAGNVVDLVRLKSAAETMVCTRVLPDRDTVADTHTSAR